MAGQIKQALEREFTCPPLPRYFKGPKKLPRDHVYCKECLRGLAWHRLNASISCHECCTVTQIPNNDFANFPTAFHMNQLVKAFQEAQEEIDYHKEATDTSAKSCTVHAVEMFTLLTPGIIAFRCLSMA